MANPNHNTVLSAASRETDSAAYRKHDGGSTRHYLPDSSCRRSGPYRGSNYTDSPAVGAYKTYKTSRDTCVQPCSDVGLTADDGGPNFCLLTLCRFGRSAQDRFEDDCHCAIYAKSV